MGETHHFIGRTAKGERVWLSMRLDRTTRPAYTTDGENTQVMNALEFAATGVTKEKGRRRWSRGGQCLDVLLEVTQPSTGWTLDEICEVHALWTRWHLNTMRAACAHMTLPESKQYDDRRHIVCEKGFQHGVTQREGAYKYGSAWLVEPLTEPVHKRILFFMGTKPQCDLPSDS